jgi:hypothetical protein
VVEAFLAALDVEERFPPGDLNLSGARVSS